MTGRRRRGLLRVTALTVVAAGCFLPSPETIDTPRCPPTRGQQMVDLINRVRVREGLPPLEVDLRLVAAAQKHADDLARHGRQGHDGSDGSLPADRVQRERYPWTLVAENTSAGYGRAAATFAGWEASPHHRANHRSDARHVGIGYAENGDTELRTYWVAVFASSDEPPLTPPSGCHP